MVRPRHLWDTPIPMRDGVELAANVYFPEGDGPWPVILNRTPYGKDTTLRAKRAAPFIAAGYAVVHVDVRGRGNSGGTYRPNFQEIEDGYDCLEWCGTRPWSTGKVGTYGGSYEGWVQVYPMRLRNPHHAAAFLMCTPSMHPFQEGFYWSGVPMPIMGMMTLFTSGHTTKEQISTFEWDKAVNIRPLKDLERGLGLEGSTREEHHGHQVFDDFYRPLWHEGLYQQMDVPCYHVTGWFDDDQKGTLELFPALAMNHPNPDVRRSQKLLIGPWPHRLSSDTSKLGDVDYGPHSMVPLPKEAIRWFDHWLKGIPNGILDEPRCRLFLMGANRWIETDSFPVSSARPRELCLGASGPANSLLGGGILGARPEGISASTFTYNPERPAPTPFWQENFQNGTNEDLRPIQRRDDVLVFTTAPLTEPLNVLGLLTAELYVSTSAVDTDFVARLSDVAPDGYAMRLNAGILRLRFRNGYEKIELVEPGEVVKIQVDLWATGHQFQPGHRLRLEVTSSAFPTWAPNYNTGGNIWEEMVPIIAENTVHHSQEYPSKLVIPELSDPVFVEAWTESRWGS